MRKILIIAILLCAHNAWCCKVCQKNQPKLLQNITHGTGPQSNYDFVIIWSAIIVVLFTLVLSLKYLIKPKEKNQDHIKHFIINK